MKEPPNNLIHLVFPAFLFVFDKFRDRKPVQRKEQPLACTDMTVKDAKGNDVVVTLFGPELIDYAKSLFQRGKNGLLVDVLVDQYQRNNRNIYTIASSKIIELD